MCSCSPKPPYAAVEPKPQSQHCSIIREAHWFIIYFTNVVLKSLVRPKDNVAVLKSYSLPPLLL